MGIVLDRKWSPVLSHARVWQAIDGLAARHGLSASALARRAGLNATTFNRSKRVGGDGRPRWPSMESIAKVLEATGASLGEFFVLLSRAEGAPPPPLRAVPITGSGDAGRPGRFDVDGLPICPDWDLAPFPATPSETLFALDVTDAAFSPLYRVGDVVVVAPTAAVRPGDRVVARYRDGRLAARVLRRASATTLEFDLGDGGAPVAVPRADIVWLGRIVWVSQ